MNARLARRDDLDSIQRIGTLSILHSYAGFLRPETLDAWLEGVYSTEALTRRWQDHPVYIVDIDGVTAAFADAFIEDDRIFLSALFTLPAFRLRGAARSLVEQVRNVATLLPVTCDVLLGNEDSEPFFERLEFVPGETLRTTIFGEQVVERRWYLDSVGEEVINGAGAAGARS